MFRRLVSVGLGCLVLGLSLVTGVNPVGASTVDQQFVTLTFEVNETVLWDNYKPVQATVTVSAQRPISGQLRVTDRAGGSGGQTVWEYDLDLAANTTVELPLVLNTGFNGVSASADFRSNGESIATESFQEFPRDDSGASGVVGVLEIDDAPRRLQELGTDRELTTIGLQTSLTGLASVSSVVASPTTIRSLANSPSGLDLESWTRSGGQLVVDGQPGSLAGAFSGQVATANPNRFEFGVGSVVFSPSWRDGIPIGGIVGSEGLETLVRNQNLGAGSAGELGFLAGLRLPPSWLIAAVLLGYGLIAGPVLFGVAQGRGNPRLIWYGLPALSLALTAVVLVGGSFSRIDRTGAHITIVEVAAEGSRATTDLMLVSRFGGQETVEAESEWNFLGQGQGASTRNLVLRPTSTELDVAVDLPSGGAAILRFEGLASNYDGLLSITEVQATRADDGSPQVSATVTNNSDVDLKMVVAFLGNERMAIDDLEAGASQRFSIDVNQDEFRTMGELLLWPSTQNQWRNNGGAIAVPTEPDAVTAAGAWTAWRIEKGAAGMGANTLGVAGWTDELASPLQNIEAGRTALFARRELDPGLRPSAHFTESFRLNQTDFQPDFFGPEGDGWQQDYRFTLGPDVDSEMVAIRLSERAIGLSFWNGQDRLFVENLPDREEVIVGVPAEAVVDGEILIQSWVSGMAHDAGATAGLVTDPTLVADGLTPTLVDSETFRHGFMIMDPGGPPNLNLTAEPFEQIEFERPVIEGDPEGLWQPFEERLDYDLIPENQYLSFLVSVGPGDRLVANMSSRDDSYLEAYAGGGEIFLEANDDFGNGLDSQLVIDFDDFDVVEIRAAGLGGQRARGVAVEIQVSQ